MSLSPATSRKNSSRAIPAWRKEVAEFIAPHVSVMPVGHDSTGR
jgi:hypothetical protein